MPQQRVLVVDDEPVMRELLPVLLASPNREVTTAVDGDDGLDKALTHRPDLIVLDIAMPGMDGFGLIRHLRSMPDFALTPVIFLTDHADDLGRRQGFQLGADDVLSKASLYQQDPTELQSRVERILEERAALANSLKELRGGAKGAPVVTGSLSALGLPSLLTIFEMERKSGVIELTGSDPERTAEVVLRDGRVLRVVLGGSAVRNIPAMAELLTWADGAFGFYRREVTGEDEIGESTTQLLLQASVVLDHADEADRER